jgi:hypothetical protein
MGEKSEGKNEMISKDCGFSVNFLMCAFSLIAKQIAHLWEKTTFEETNAACRH